MSEEDLEIWESDSESDPGTSSKFDLLGVLFFSLYKHHILSLGLITRTYRRKSIAEIILICVVERSLSERDEIVGRGRQGLVARLARSRAT